LPLAFAVHVLAAEGLAAPTPGPGELGAEEVAAQGAVGRRPIAAPAQPAPESVALEAPQPSPTPPPVVPAPTRLSRTIGGPDRTTTLFDYRTPAPRRGHAALTKAPRLSLEEQREERVAAVHEMARRLAERFAPPERPLKAPETPEDGRVRRRVRIGKTGPVHVNARLPAELVARVEDLGGEGGRTAGLKRAAELGLATLDSAERLIPAAVAGSAADGDVEVVVTPRLRLLLIDDPAEAAAIEAQLSRQKQDFERFAAPRQERERLVEALADAVVHVLRRYGDVLFGSLCSYLMAAWRERPDLLDERWTGDQVARHLTAAVRRVVASGRVAHRKHPRRLVLLADDDERRREFDRRTDRAFHTTLLSAPLRPKEREVLAQVRPWVQRHRRVTSEQIAEEWEIDAYDAWRLMRAMADDGEVVQEGRLVWRAVRGA